MWLLWLSCACKWFLHVVLLLMMVLETVRHGERITLVLLWIFAMVLELCAAAMDLVVQMFVMDRSKALERSQLLTSRNLEILKQVQSALGGEGLQTVDEKYDYCRDLYFQYYPSPGSIKDYNDDELEFCKNANHFDAIYAEYGRLDMQKKTATAIQELEGHLLITNKHNTWQLWQLNLLEFCCLLALLKIYFLSAVN